MLIDVKNLFKIYHEGEESEVRALDGVSLSVDRGEFLAIIGQSGSGKSTLMNILGCLDIPTYGDYHLDGVDVTELSDRQLAHIRNKQIGFIFQGYQPDPRPQRLGECGAAPHLPGGARLQAGTTGWRPPWSGWVWRTAPGTSPPRCPAASSSGWPSPGPSPPSPPSSWPTSPPAPWTPTPASTCWRSSTACMRRGTTIILITHDNGIAATAERVVRISDGHIIYDGDREGAFL